LVTRANTPRKSVPEVGRGAGEMSLNYEKNASCKRGDKHRTDIPLDRSV